MKRRTWLLLATVAIPVGCTTYALVDLNVVKHGVHFVAPDGFRYQVRPNSWVTRITGSDETTLGEDQIHLTWPRHGQRPPSSYLVCHALTHLRQRRESAANPNPTRSPLFELKHITSRRFRDSVETEAMAFGMTHLDDPHCEFVAKALAERVKVKP